MWIKAKLGIVNLAHATQIYPWERSYATGVAGRGWEVRATFHSGDTISLSDHATREEAEERVGVLFRRLEKDAAPEQADPSFILDAADARAAMGVM